MPTPSQPKTDVILERMQFVQDTVNKIDTVLDKLTCKFSDFQLVYTEKHQLLVSKVEDTEKRLTQHDLDIKTLQISVQTLSDVIKPLVATNRILTWMAGIIGLGIISFIGMVLFHQIQVIIP